MNPERILIFSRAIPLHRIGGMEMLTWDLAKAFKKRGFEVIIGTSEVQGYGRKFEKDGISIETIPDTVSARYCANFWRGTLDIYEREGRNTAAAVLSVSSAGRQIALSRDSSEIPIVMQAHGTSLGEIITKWRARSIKEFAKSSRNIYWLWKDRLAIKKYDAAICVSESVRGELMHPLSRLGSAPQEVVVINNGIDTSVFRPDNPLRLALREKLHWSNDPVVVCSCRLHAEKGVAQLIRAFIALLNAEPRAKLLLVGDGPERERLTLQVDQAGLGNKVHFAGAVSRETVAAYLAVGDVFAFLSLRLEGAPLNLLEALSVGKPCVLSRDLLDRVPGSDCVWGVDPSDPRAAADAILQALESAKFGRRAQLPQEFSIEHCADRYLDLFSRLRKRKQNKSSL
ncbi:glycosyltransferase family 4 protein [Paraburkholderia nemoris]|uniref:glycosyltransferase family 4 protein n=1 Tax=Paraburkholderia nemoris TaxID=2793076 RepID=UPI0038BA9420